ncbi:retron system putative HNH endonuclease [Thermophilibacter sp.]
MIAIEKGNPPGKFVSEVKSYKAENGRPPSWDEIRCKPEVTASLVSEQGGLCAYCMSRIRATHDGGIQDAHVEHIIPQSKSRHGEDVDYGNMLAVCDGKHGESRTAWSCDRFRGNKDLVVNPLQSQTLQFIRYRSDGTILSDDNAVK